MRFALKDYQSDAVADVLRNLADARDDWHRKKRPVGFSLTATTGAGKTVMAAAVIEALFEGNDDLDFDADPGAVVLWFTDDPTLNEQTRFKLMESGDRIPSSRLVVIENTFNQEKLDPGKVYFLNAQKLSKNSRLVKGEQLGADQLVLMDHEVSPDLRAFTMWDMLRNTIEDERLTLYVILDEAHRGMKAPSSRDRSERQTTVKRLVNGGAGSPAVPVVLGISATIDRFNKAMADATGRLMYPPVVVDPVQVQQSGLLKDDIRLDFPAEVGQFDTVLLARATKKVIESTALWSEYAAAQESPTDAVAPLLVVQVPNTPSDDLLAATIATIRDSWPELGHDAIAHVFGEHAALTVGAHSVPYISPERVQDATYVRVLLAKDAISTGWDCPRAEVLVSFRPAKDETHITQLLGRMVRTPLARRIPGNDRLNSVECLLPHFNRKTASGVAEVLLGSRPEGDDDRGDSGGGDGRRVLFAPVDVDVNSAIPASVWTAFDKLPSQTLPRKAAKPVKRLTALAQALARDGIRDHARRDAYDELFSVLDGLLARHKKAIEAGASGILEVEGETLVAQVGSGEVAQPVAFSEVADDRAVEAAFKAAARTLAPDVARKYADHIGEESDGDDGLFDAHIKVAALAEVEGVRDELERAAGLLAKKWLSEYRVAIKNLSDERRAVYDEIIALSPEPEAIDVLRPRVRTEETQDAAGAALATRQGHLMSGPDGEFPVASLNDWEIQVLDSEMAQTGFLAWYRNPSRASADSLAIAYQDAAGNWRRMCPDFVFFHGDEDAVRTSIVDPHGIHLSDSILKLRGLAAYAAAHEDDFHRIEAVAKSGDGTLRVLDMKRQDVRDAIAHAEDAGQLYGGDLASDY